ncbi:class I SAM-dependent methyltransferase [Isoalcanivorax beigongshangi]|uniref:Class I SAM-dependent methyltransferase n=1 Tax=Isoalcanivorax beigongshangi TaxID=3238810 RepID=A0ABV4AEM8_9GAMM
MFKRDATDTSSISFTALYTGHVWEKNGLSAPAFHTRTGALLYHALAPFEAVGGRLVGGNIRTFLLQRHHLIDHLLEQAISDGVTQVIEIACGLSPRGYRFRQRYPQLHYIEADLPDMADRKQALLARLGALGPRHQALPLNIFHEQGADSLEQVLADHFDRSRPLLVITEGLVNYFPLTAMDPFWRRLARAMQGFPFARYLTDNYPLLDDHPFHRTMQTLRGLLGAVSRSSVSFHFGSDAEAGHHVQAQGFDHVTVHNPEHFYQTLPIPVVRGTPFVRVIEARTGA